MAAPSKKLFGTKPPPREKQVLSFCADGYTAAETADKLGLTRKTVEYNLRKLRNRFGSEDRFDLILRAIVCGDLSTDYINLEIRSAEYQQLLEARKNFSS